MREYLGLIRALSLIYVLLRYSVIKNVAHLCGRNRSKMWGPEGWKKVVVCVVSDGRNKVNKRTLQVLNLVRSFMALVFFHLISIRFQMGCYQEGIAKDSVGGKDVTAHIFEYVYPVSLLLL